MGKDSGVIYKSFVDAVRVLDPETQLEAYNAYYAYLFDGEDYTGDNAMVKALMLMAKPSIDKAQNRYDAAVENGRKGGRPPKPEKNQNETRTKPEQNQSKTRTKPEQNLTVAVADTVAVNDTVTVSSNEDKKRHPRHRFGEYGHVLLSDEELQKLETERGKERTDAAIRKVDEYCESHGKTYKNYYLVLRKWGYEDLGPPGNMDETSKRLAEAWIHE